MKTFKLVRDIDETGVSGTGVVAEGVEFRDGTVAMRWITDHRSTCLYDCLAHVQAIHGHGGKTRVVRANGRAVGMTVNLVPHVRGTAR